MEQFGIKETKEGLDFLFDIADAVIDSLEGDGKITIRDAPKFLKPMRTAMGGVGGIQDIPKELADLSSAELDELCAHVSKRFDLKDDEIEVRIEDILKLSCALVISIRDLYLLSKNND